MKYGDIITHEDVGEKFYLLYDETDTNHCILIGEYRTLKETAKAAKGFLTTLQRSENRKKRNRTKILYRLVKL